MDRHVWTELALAGGIFGRALLYIGVASDPPTVPLPQAEPSMRPLPLVPMK